MSEKHEKICSIKDKAIELMELGLNQDVSCIDSKELYELMDIIKDCEETLKYSEEMKYYKKITDAMEKNSEEENSMYLDKYLPESRSRYYTKPKISQWHIPYYDEIEPEMMDRDMDYPYRNRMYYTEPKRIRNMIPEHEMNERDYREGKSPMTRKNYMEMNSSMDKNAKIEEMKKYSHELVDDLTDMIQSASSEEKIALKQILTQFVSKLA